MTDLEIFLDLLNRNNIAYEKDNKLITAVEVPLSTGDAAIFLFDGNNNDKLTEVY